MILFISIRDRTTGNFCAVWHKENENETADDIFFQLHILKMRDKG